MHEIITHAKHSIRSGIVELLEYLSLDELAVVYMAARAADRGAFFQDSRDGSREKPFVGDGDGIDYASTWYWYYARKIAAGGGLNMGEDIDNLLWWKLQEDLLCKWYDHHRGFTVCDIVEDYRMKRDNAYARFPEAKRETV